MLIRPDSQAEVAECDLLASHHADLAKLKQWRCGVLIHRQVKNTKDSELRIDG